MSAKCRDLFIATKKAEPVVIKIFLAEDSLYLTGRSLYNL